MKFKVGDKVRGQYGSTVYTGTVLKIENALVEVKRDDIYGLPWECLIRPNGEVAGANRCDDGIHNLELINSTKIMSKLNNMMKRLLDADTQTLVKAEYINGDLELTEKGREALDSVLFAEKKSELVNLAQAELDEAKK